MGMQHVRVHMHAPMRMRSGELKLKPQEIANAAWAYATVGHEAPALLDALADAAEANVAR